MEKEIKINKVEYRTSKKGVNYMVAETSDGNFSIFEEDVMAKMKENVNHLVSVEVAEKNGFRNIRAFNNIVLKTQAMPVKKDDKPRQSFNQGAMFVSYAKDLFIHLVEKDMELAPSDLMNSCISLIKQAQKEFS